jgi:adenine deaminase
MRRYLVTYLFIVACALPKSWAEPPEENEIAIRGARILTMEGRPIEKGTIIIRGSNISQLGANVSIPPGAQVVDATGLTAMPGIIDAEGIAPGHRIRGLE